MSYQDNDRRRSSTRQNSTPTRGQLNSDKVDLTSTKRDFPPTGKMLNCYGLPRFSRYVCDRLKTPFWCMSMLRNNSISLGLKIDFVNDRIAWFCDDVDRRKLKALRSTFSFRSIRSDGARTSSSSKLTVAETQSGPLILNRSRCPVRDRNSRRQCQKVVRVGDGHSVSQLWHSNDTLLHRLPVV